MLRLIMNKKLLSYAKGQVVLMVLLVSALVLSLVLSAARQATVETSIDTDQELLKRAFNAAESGIDYFIKTGKTELGSSDSPEGGSRLEVQDLGNQTTLTYDRKVGSENGEFFWLVDHTETGEIGTDFFSGHDNAIDICVNGTAITNLKVDYFYNEAGNYKVRRGDGANPIITTAGGGSNCVSYTLLPQSILLVVTPVGTDSIISISGGYNFPVQGIKIKSTGMVGKVNNLVTIDRPYKLTIPFLLEPVVSEGLVTN